MFLKPISESTKNMANGMKDNSKTPLTLEEIELIKTEIGAICANEDKRTVLLNIRCHISSKRSWQLVGA